MRSQCYGQGRRACDRTLLLVGQGLQHLRQTFGVLDEVRETKIRHPLPENDLMVVDSLAVTAQARNEDGPLRLTDCEQRGTGPRVSHDDARLGNECEQLVVRKEVHHLRANELAPRAAGLDEHPLAARFGDSVSDRDKAIEGLAGANGEDDHSVTKTVPS
jgi:hypothetical protein